MRVLFTSTRGVGHLNPLIPYARILQRLGHEVRVAAPSEASDQLRSYGFDHVAFDAPSEADIRSVTDRTRNSSRDEIVINFTRGVFAELNPRAALPKLKRAIADWTPDLVVRESVEFAGALAAEEAGIPHVRVAVHCGFVERRLIDRVAGVIDGHRLAMGLTPDEGAALRDAPAFTSFPATLDGLSPGGLPRHLLRARDVPEELPRQDFRPAWMPDSWGDTLDRPLVYVTFGTEAGTSAKTQAAYRTALDAVRLLPMRALLTTGPNMRRSDLGPIPPNVTVEQFIPQAEIFPWCEAVLCHGGSGTLLGAASAGLPMVITPLFADQPENARLLSVAGAGVAVADGDAGTVAAAIDRVLADVSIRQAARKIRDEMALMASIETAANEMLRLTA